MINTDIETRRARYYALSSQLAQVDNNQLDSLLGEMPPTRGWGGTHTIKMGASKVFIKRIPVTEMEYDNLFSTENLYHLPTFYNYGVGSAGFGAFRELVAHIKTTNWVLDGSIANFPLMYHYRIVPFTGQHREIDLERHQGYIKYWNSDANIDRYIRERRTAKYEIILFLEHFPHVLGRWLVGNLDKSETVIREMRHTITFLREHGIIHFDAHFDNIVIGEGRPYLTDFGLVLDKSFTLDNQEKEFFKRHVHYDDAEFLACLGSYQFALYRALSISAKKKMRQRYGIGEEPDYTELSMLLLRCIEEIHATGLMKLDDSYVAELVNHRDLILSMYRFYSDIRKNDRKDTPYPHTKVRRLLNETKL